MSLPFTTARLIVGGCADGLLVVDHEVVLGQTVKHGFQQGESASKRRGVKKDVG